ncbi:MAG TPA: pentapeptide repeat-containing protein, partial [Candidatus Tumulicola sp.]|nr:pentapeptide repeat-containing protein [Candidatus Tumulicola sp.]
LAGVEVVGSDFNDSNLSGASLQNARLVADDFNGANLRNVNFQGAALCAHDDSVDDDGAVRYGRLHCSDFSGADLHGANFRGAQICDYAGRGRAGRCTALDAATLRNLGHANLDGAEGP